MGSNHVSAQWALTDPSVPARVSLWPCGLLRAEERSDEPMERRRRRRVSPFISTKYYGAPAKGLFSSYNCHFGTKPKVRDSNVFSCVSVR